MSGALTVNKAPLTVTANDDSKIYDGFAYSGGNGVTYSGFVNGETSAVLGGTLVYGGSAQGALDVGNYALTLGGLTSGNYAIAFNDGTLTIGARVPAIPGVPANGYSGATTSVAASATTSGNTGGSAISNAADSTSGGIALLAVDSGDSAVGSNAQIAADGNVQVAAISNAQGVASGSIQGAAGGNTQGGNEGNTSSADATADSFATEYQLVTHGCGQRLPSGLGC